MRSTMSLDSTGLDIDGPSDRCDSRPRMLMNAKGGNISSVLLWNGSVLNSFMLGASCSKPS